MRLRDWANGDGWPNGDGCSDPMDDDRLPEMIVGLSPEKFSGDFSGDFLGGCFWFPLGGMVALWWGAWICLGIVPGNGWRMCTSHQHLSVAMMDQIELMLEAIQKRHNDPKDFTLVRLWLGFVRLPSSLWFFSKRRWKGWCYRDPLIARRMSGNRIASVCRLRARASNYLPPILLIYFTSRDDSLNRLGACVAYLNKRNCWVCRWILFAASPFLGKPWTQKAGTCDPCDLV